MSTPASPCIIALDLGRISAVATIADGTVRAVQIPAALIAETIRKAGAR